MARSNQLQRVFAELRQQRPNDSVRELLALAEYIIKAHRHPERFLAIRIGRVPFNAMPIDQAMGDGGWAVLEFERRAGMFKQD